MMHLYTFRIVFDDGTEQMLAQWGRLYTDARDAACARLSIEQQRHIKRVL